MIIRKGEDSEDDLLVEHYRALWDSYNTPPDDYRPDAEDQVRLFLREGRARHQLATFFAEVDGTIAGSSSCQLQVPPYPNVIKPALRFFGSIWHVYVLPDFGRRGIGRALTQAAVDHLRQLGCTTAVLNASDAGEPLYASMGFARAKEMRLPL